MPTSQVFWSPDLELVTWWQNPVTPDLYVTLRQLQTLELCSACQVQMSWHGRRDLRDIADTQLGGRRVKLHIHRRRSICACGCKQVGTLVTPFVQPGFKLTRRLFEYMGWQFQDPRLRFDQIAAAVGVSSRVTGRVFQAIADAFEQRQQQARVLGGVLRIAEVRVGKKRHYLLINVDEKALVDLTETTRPDELRALLVKVSGRGKPIRMWIPMDEQVREVAREVFPGMRLALARSTRYELLEKAAAESKKIVDENVRQQVNGRLMRAVAPPHGAQVGGLSLSDQLTQVTEDAKRLKLNKTARLLTTWCEEILYAQRPLNDQPGEATHNAVQSIARSLQAVGHGYSGSVLRQRLMYCLPPVTAYEEDRTNRTSLMTGMSLGPHYTTRPEGPFAGVFGVSLDAVAHVLELAVLKWPFAAAQGPFEYTPRLPERTHDQD